MGLVNWALDKQGFAKVMPGEVHATCEIRSHDIELGMCKIRYTFNDAIHSDDNPIKTETFSISEGIYDIDIYSRKIVRNRKICFNCWRRISCL